MFHADQAILLHCKRDSGAHVSLSNVTHCCQLTTGQAQRQLQAAIQHQGCAKSSQRGTGCELSVLPGQASDNLANLRMTASRQAN